MSFLRIYIVFFSILVSASIALAQEPVSKTVSDSITNYIEKSRFYEETEPDSAVRYCNSGMRLAKARNDWKGQALILVQMGRINNLHHHADLARRFANEALSIFRNLGERDGIAMAYDELGVLDGESNNPSAANSDFTRSLKYYEDVRDSTGIAQTYYSQGSLLEQKGETEQALTWYLRALVQYEHRSHKPPDYFILLEHISHIYDQKGNRQSALHYLEEGVRSSDDPSLPDTEVNILGDEAKLEESHGDNSQALFFYKKELVTARKYNNLEGQAKALAGMGEVLIKDSTTRSLAYLKQALNIAKQLKQPRLKATIYEALADTYHRQKNYKEAMMMLNEHRRLLDSLLIVATNSEISALDSSYILEAAMDQVDKLQAINKRGRTELELGILIIVIIVFALLLLWLYLWRIKRLNHRLKDANDSRTKLFSIIGHDLKGPAGNAIQLLEIMETSRLPEEQLKKMLTELKKQSVSSFELLNALFEWGKTQIQGVEVKLETLATKGTIERNIALLEPLATRKNIVITDNTPEDARIHADAHHFDFVIRNLLSNAIKFTYPDGKIGIRAACSAASITFSVTDNGIGISKDKQNAFLKDNLPVSFGTKGEKGSGLGLLLIKEFMRANKGRVWLESREGQGTTFYFSFPAQIENH